jgi:hypothetical protein
MVSSSCRPIAKSGFGNRLNRPSFSIAAAPVPISSAGCPTSINVPFHDWRCDAIHAAVPAHAAICKSWPQACITGTGCPAAFFAVTRLAKGAPVFSSTGNASSSVRSMTVGPAPLRSSPTTPVPPTPVVTS